MRRPAFPEIAAHALPSPGTVQIVHVPCSMGIRNAIVVVFVLFVSMSAATGSRAQTSSPADPFGFLQPAIQLSDDDRRKLDRREVVLNILPADGHELAAMAAASLDAGPDALVRSVRNIADLKKGPLVPQIARFSPQPRIDDLRQLTLDDVDVTDLSACRPQDCDLKLAPEEITRLQRAMPGDGANADGRARLDREFRQILWQRARLYLMHGDDKPAPEFLELLRHSPYLSARMPALATYLERYPRVRLAGAESFLYWSKEVYASKPMVTLTHVTILRGNGQAGAPEVLVVSRDIFSTRYTSGSLALTLLVRAPGSSSQRYLVYINRTWIDGVRALWRPVVEHRIKSQARKIFADVRDRIERGTTIESAAAAKRVGCCDANSSAPHAPIEIR
jgi:hypothetical protein